MHKYHYFFIGTKIDATKVVKSTLRKHYSLLLDATEDCLKSVTAEFFSKCLISREVRRSPSFDKIENEFVASLSFCKENMAELEEKCRDFVHCLAKAGGPAKEAAIALAEDWEHEIMNKYNLKWSLKFHIETSTDLSLQSEIQLSSKDEVPQKMQNLREKFLLLLKHIRAYYNECKQYNVKDIARYLTDDYEEPLTKEPLTDCQNFDTLFHSVKIHYNFFKFDLIEDLAKEFPLSDDLQLELDQYVLELEQFKKSTALQQMKNAIKRVPLPHEASEVHCKIVIKLSGTWRDKTIDSLEKLIQYLFKRDAKRAKLIEIDDGSITVMFLALSTAESLIDKVQNRIQLTQCLGIFKIIINNQFVIDRVEDVNFTFEDSLLYAINHIDSHEEYENVALLLIELKAQLNYQNTNGHTALLLASEGGHIEIFKSLLQNGADPFVKKTRNEGYIGLNSLACTALSQHIYKSIGEEKIVPQDNTTVEDMLELAVKKRGVSSSLYNLFTFVIRNNLKMKFQWLQKSFYGLNSIFIDTVACNLTSKALVTEARQNFQLYIRENATCENVYQFLQLLEPHYSCLNINLLKIMCTVTEPIKEQVEDFKTKLQVFKDTTSLLELATMTKEAQYPDTNCSKLFLRFSKSWCSRTIAELNKMEDFYLLPISYFLTLQEVHLDACSCSCTYTVPQLQTQTIIETVSNQRDFLYKIGIFKVIVNDIPIIMEDEDTSFSFEAALQKARKNNDEKVLFFLLDLNIKLHTYPLKNDNTALISACKVGDYLTVQSLLNNDPDINMKNDEGDAALISASCFGHHQVVELLLSKDPDINIQNNDGWTALMFASFFGHHKVVELLLSKDPDINIQDNAGLTALISASRFKPLSHESYKVVELLLSKDPDINIQNNDGWTALMSASRYGDHRVVELLLNKNPDINIKNNDGWTALIFASRFGHQQVVELLLSKDLDINVQTKDGWTSLMAASNYGHHQVVKLLLSKDPDMDIQRNGGYTALLAASHHGYHKVVELLLSKNPDINVQSNSGLTALNIASRHGHHQVVELLLSKNPDINIQNKNGYSALIVASALNHHLIVELLLSKDLNINIQDNNGWTALMAASCHGHKKVVELLLRKDSDINIQNNNGVTALMLGSGNGHHQVVELLLSKNPDINFKNIKGWTALMAASCFDHHQVVELLLSKDPNINIQDNVGWTIVMAASRFGHHQVVKLLLSKNPDIDIQNNYGWTTLMIASRHGHQQVVELLLSKDPDINIHNNGGRTALMYASRYGHHQVVELLLSKNLYINIQDNDGWTALMIASCYGHHQVVELLLSKDPDINIENKYGMSALTFALACSSYIFTEFALTDDLPLDQHSQVLNQLRIGNCLKIFKLLLNYHPNHIHTLNNKKLHSLAVAASAKNFDAVTILMEKCEITPENIISAFTQACYGSHSHIMIYMSEKITILSNSERKLLVAAVEGDLGTLISMLYDFGMSPDTPLVAGITPLMIAASCGHIELVEALIQAGADVSKRNDERFNALNIVNIVQIVYDRANIRQLLIDNTPASELPDAEPIKKKPSTVTMSLKSILYEFDSNVKKECDPYNTKQQELKATFGITNTPYSSMTSSVGQLVS